MPRKNCPKCEADISETYQRAEPDLGIFASGWVCEACDLFVEEDDQDFDDYDPDRGRPRD